LREIGIGLLGVGWMGQLHSASYRRVRDHYPACQGTPRLVIAADASQERARAASEELGYESWTADWREVLAHPEVDAVSITAPNFLHLEMALAAAEAGKHIWVEKPLGRFPAETVRAADGVTAAGVRNVVGLNYRHAPAVQYARRLIASGEIGEVNHYRSQFLASYASHPQGGLSWRFSRDLAGYGILYDLMSHEVDLAQFLLGPIARVTGRWSTLIKRRPRLQMGTGTHFTVGGNAELGEVENEDRVTALVEFETGVIGTIESSRVAVGPEARYVFEANGTEGAVAWNFERMNELQLCQPLPSGDRGYCTVYMSPNHPDFAHFQPGPGLPMSYSDLKVIEAYLFMESIVDGVQRTPGVAEMAAAARVLDAIARSAESEAWEEVGGLSAPLRPSEAAGASRPDGLARSRALQTSGSQASGSRRQAR
jgi:predicted dehydrogenase